MFEHSTPTRILPSADLALQTTVDCSSSVWWAANSSRVGAVPSCSGLSAASAAAGWCITGTGVLR